MRWLRIKTARGTLDLKRFAGTLWYFSGMLRAHVGVLTLALIATVATILLSIAAPWPVQVVLDNVILGRKPRHGLNVVLKPLMNWLGGDRDALLWIACGSVVLIAILQGLTDYASQLLQASTAHEIANRLRRRVFKHLQSLSLRFHEKSRTGDLLLRLTGDVTMVRDLLVESMFDLATVVLTAIGLLIVMYRLSPALTFVAVATIPLVAIVSMVMSIKLRSHVKKAREKEGDLISVAGEVLAGMALVQAFTREEEEKDRFSRLGRSSLRANLRTVRLESQLARTVQIVTALGVCGILYLGVGQVRTEQMTPGVLVVFMAYFNSLLKPIRQASRLAAKVAKSSSCADRIREVLETPAEIHDLPGAKPAAAFEGRIIFDHVNFSYVRGDPTLHDVCFEILPGQRIALVGPTGAGKSTLIKLLLRFYDPNDGAIRIDGVDLRAMTLESLRRQISVVQQETVLFGTTIAENIAMGKSGATLEDVRVAAAALDIDDWIRSLPDGYQTRIGERGVNLSGGQRQLVALARALLRDGRILVFDEPTTGLDGATELRIRAALARVMRGRTTIIISHGMRPIADVDRIVVLRMGRVVQTGSHEELITQPGVFQSLFAQDPQNIAAEVRQ